MICGNCQAENRPERKFCLRCGQPLAARCPNCGASNEPDAAFCGECGTRLDGPSRPSAVVSDTAAVSGASGAPHERSPSAPVAERRFVSVLFADLVGYTSFAEGLDAEDARDLLSRYFRASREIVERYGGTIEKFIGDAVMAVWGAPTAREDDAERAVRAALDLTAMAPTLVLGRGDATTRIELRAGVLTGEAAVTLGADGQGMVAGDLVNTASRLQSVAEPGTVLVGEATFRAASGAITFEPVADQMLKGKQTPVPAWRATAVVAKVRGAGRSEIAEPPFVGREAEFAALKERLHATSRDGRARLVSIVGAAGIGKSRLAWEFEKYLDGLVETVYWHHGRSPAYGEGLAFWALGEMIRRRAGIAERDDQATTLEKLAACLAECVPNEDDQRWIGPRLRALLGLEEAPPGSRDELFAAWRTFFELIAARGTAILVFEDLHWADSGLIDFIESILEWSRSHRIVVVTLARPELLERRPTWGAGQRDFLALHLEPLPAAAVSELVNGLAPGLPAALVARIVDRAEGVPLYAVEMFRMLVDRGQLIAGPDGYRPVTDLPDLEVPETLQALIAARLDALPPAERRILQDASVLGKTFTLESLAAVSGEPPAAAEPLLRGLVRREILTIDADVRSPERGQYGFIGALVREVAYSTLARRDRRERHRAAARFFEALGDDELAGVLASHYADAYAASQPGREAEAVAAQARIALRAAADRALSLGSAGQAVTYLDQAFRVTTDPADIAHLHEEIARAARQAGLYDRAESAGREAIERYGTLEDRAGMVRSSADLGQIYLFGSRVPLAMDVLRAALAAADEQHDASLLVRIKRMLARAEMFSAQPQRALGWCEEALTLAANLDDVEAIADLMVTRSWALASLSRLRESLAELRGALELARENGVVQVELRAINNLASFFSGLEPRRSVELLKSGLALAERVGDADYRDKLAFAGLAALFAGDWQWGVEVIDARLRDDLPLLSWITLAAGRAIVLAWRGHDAEAADVLTEMRQRVAAGGTHQDDFGLHTTELWLALAAGDLPAARVAAAGVVSSGAVGGYPYEGYAYGGLAAALQGDLAAVRDSIDQLAHEPARFTAIVSWQTLLTAALAVREGRTREAAALYREALDGLHRSGNEFAAALAGLDAAASLGQADPTGAATAEDVRRFAAQNDVPVLVTLLERSLGPREAERDRRGVTPEAVAAARARER